eukprot:COSAG06_NODE_11428_length_1512_cov_1.106865_2_plen_29_part_01
MYSQRLVRGDVRDRVVADEDRPAAVEDPL